MNNSFEKLKDYFMPVLSILVVIVLVPLLILPTLQKIVDASKVINANKTRLNTVEQKAKDLEALNQNKESINQELNIAESALPINKDVATLVLGVQQIAINAGLKVDGLKIQPGKSATSSATPQNQTSSAPTAPGAATLVSTPDNLIFEINLSGSLSNFENYLKSMEIAKRILTLSQFKTSPETSGSDFSFDVFIDAPFGQLPTLSKDQIAQALPQLSESNKKLLNSLSSASFQNVTLTPLPSGPTGVTNPFQ